MIEAKSPTELALARRKYLIGYLLALILTIVPFWLTHTNEMHAAARPMVLAIVAFLAIVQVFVHLRYFLHLDFKETPREDLTATAFTLVLMLIMIGGTIWIMFDLNMRMM